MSRKRHDVDPPVRAVVLGGGGKWGAVQVGMLQALVEVGRVPDLVTGTSIGALNGALFCQEPTEAGVARLRSLWVDGHADQALASPPTQRLRALATLRPALHQHGGLEQLLHRFLHTERIEDLPLPFSCVAASIERAAPHWFDHGPLVPALLASAAIPGLLPPVEIDGEHFLDGGLVDSIPVDRAVAAGATEIYVLQVGRIEQPLEPPRRLHDAALVAFEIARRHRFHETMEHLPSTVRVHVLPSGHTLAPKDIRQLRWRDTGDAVALIEGARRASAAHLEGIPT